MSFRAAMASGLLFRLTRYSRPPTLAMPVGSTRFCVLIAVATSWRRQSLGLQRLGIQVDDDLPELAPRRQRHARPLDRAQHGPHPLVHVVEDLLLGDAVAAERQLQDGHAAGGVADDHRRGDARGHAPGDRLRHRRHQRHDRGQVGPRLQVHPDHRGAVEGLALDPGHVLHVVGQRILAELGDLPFNLLGRQALVAPDDADDRDVDVGKDVRGRLADHLPPHRQQQQGSDDEGIRAPQRESDYPHRICPRWLSCRRGRVKDTPDGDLVTEPVPSPPGCWGLDRSGRTACSTRAGRCSCWPGPGPNSSPRCR